MSINSGFDQNRDARSEEVTAELNDSERKARDMMSELYEHCIAHNIPMVLGMEMTTETMLRGTDDTEGKEVRFISFCMPEKDEGPYIQSASLLQALRALEVSEIEMRRALYQQEMMRKLAENLLNDGELDDDIPPAEKTH